MSPYLNHPSKRLLDIVFSILVLPVALIVLTLAILATLVTSGTPVFFDQERVGQYGKIFKLRKIRSLKKHFDSAPGAFHSNDDITFVGQFLRKTRVDEIPQIWNILTGEMSWVGPRPEVSFHYEHYKALHPEYARRQVAKPGITGLAQLNDPNASPNENLEKLKFDLDYVDNASLSKDIGILIKSFIIVWK